MSNYFHLSSERLLVGATLQPRKSVRLSLNQNNDLVRGKEGFFVATYESLKKYWKQIFEDVYHVTHYYVYEVEAAGNPDIVICDINEELQQLFVCGEIKIVRLVNDETNWEYTEDEKLDIAKEVDSYCLANPLDINELEKWTYCEGTYKDIIAKTHQSSFYEEGTKLLVVHLWKHAGEVKMNYDVVEAVTTN